MRYSTFLPTTALASALLLGCSDQPVGTNPNPDATPPLMAAVSRVETPFFVFFVKFTGFHPSSSSFSIL